MFAQARRRRQKTWEKGVRGYNASREWKDEEQQQQQEENIGDKVWTRLGGSSWQTNFHARLVKEKRRRDEPPENPHAFHSPYGSVGKHIPSTHTH